jgi:hypothetical protein
MNIETVAQFQRPLETVFKNKDADYKFNSFFFVHFFLNIFETTFLFWIKV